MRNKYLCEISKISKIKHIAFRICARRQSKKKSQIDIINLNNLRISNTFIKGSLFKTTFVKLDISSEEISLI